MVSNTVMGTVPVWAALLYVTSFIDLGAPEILHPPLSVCAPQTLYRTCASVWPHRLDAEAAVRGSTV